MFPWEDLSSSVCRAQRERIVSSRLERAFSTLVPTLLVTSPYGRDQQQPPEQQPEPSDSWQQLEPPECWPPRNRAMFEGPIRSAFSDMEQKIKTRGSLSKANNIHSYLTKCLGWVLVGISNMPGLYLVVAEWLPKVKVPIPVQAAAVGYCVSYNPCFFPGVVQD